MFKTIFTLIIAALLLNAAHAAAEPLLQTPYDKIRQGQVMAVWGSGFPAAGIMEMEFMKNRFPVVITGQGDVYALIGAELNARPGRQTINLLREGQVLASMDITVSKGNYGTRNIRIGDAEDGAGVNPAIVRHERAISHAIYSQATRDILGKPFDDKLISSFMYWQMPLIGPLTSGFGLLSIVNGKVGSPHAGVDIKGNTGDPVKAAAAGRVVLAQSTQLGGNTVLVDHGTGIVSGYRHLSEIKVKMGDDVNQGDVIGLVGSTGRSTGPHLHFDVRLSGVAVDPLSVLIYTTFLRGKWEGRDSY